MKKKIMFISIIFFLVLLLFGIYNYGFYETVIPTDTDVKAKIKLPNEWEIIEENNIIKIVNRSDNKVIAEQIAAGYRKIIDEKIFDKSDPLMFNETISYDITNPSNYTFTKGYSNAVYKYSFNYEQQSIMVLDFRIFYLSDGSEYRLILMVYDEENYEKMEKSISFYRFGGYIN